MLDASPDQGYSRGIRESLMKSCRFTFVAVLLVAVCAGELFAQAAAEAVLTHGASSAAGSSLGKTLGNALGNAASQLGGRLGQQTSTAPKVQRIPANKQKAAMAVSASTNPAVAPSSGSLIASIEGAAPASSVATANCAAAKPEDSNSSQSTSLPTAKLPPATSPAKSCPAAQESDSHPAVVNLPAAN